MDFAMDNLGQFPDLLKSKSIQGNQTCQIHHHGAELATGRGNEKDLRFIRFIVVTLALVGSGAIAEAQQAKKLYRIGYLSPSASLQASPSQEAFRQGLRKLGYVEGQNIALEWRFTKDKADVFLRLAAALVRLKVDCIVSVGYPAPVLPSRRPARFRS